MNYNNYEFRVENKEELEQLDIYFHHLGISLAHDNIYDLEFPMTTAVEIARIGYCCSRDSKWPKKRFEDDYNKAIPVHAVLNPDKYPEYFI